LAGKVRDSLGEDTLDLSVSVRDSRFSAIVVLMELAWLPGDLHYLKKPLVRQPKLA